MVLAHDINQGQRTQDVKISEDVTFNTMLLAPITMQGLRECGFYKPSPIQLHGIPMGKCGFDLMLEAKSGTGKTAVFTVIALEKLDFSKGLQVVILAPTREIAAQICDVIIQIGVYYEALNVEVVMGGLPVQEDILKFKKLVHIVVGSPGRLRHLIQDNHINISAVRLLVLDEADKLMEKSFQSDINYIFSILPKQKQVIMSSATYPEVSKSFINKYVHNAQHICPDSDSILLGLEQKVTITKYNSNIVRQTQHRFEELLKILSKHQFKQCLIFCNYQARIGELHKMLTREKWPAEQLYGQQEQSDRLDALKTLQEYKCRILISTDLAARGIDASNVDLVVNFEPPFEWQTYLHRIGRAGRYGAYGIAITILSEGKEEMKFKEVLRSINISFELRNLWNDSKFCIQSLTSSINQKDIQTNLDIHPKSTVTIHPQIAQNVKDNKKYEDLWNILTGKSCERLDCLNEILNFEKLCESFVNSKECNVDSFSDLLCSFQNHDDDNKGDLYQYKNLDINKINIDEYLNSIPNNKSVPITNKLCNNPVQTEIKGCGHCNIAKGKQNIGEIIINNINYSCHEGLSANKSQNEIEQINTQEINLNNREGTLLAAGLPTSFSSSKNKTKINNYANTMVSNCDFGKRLSDKYNNDNKFLNEHKIQKKKVRNNVLSTKEGSTMSNRETPARDTDKYLPAYNIPSSQYNGQFNVVYNEHCYRTASGSSKHYNKIHDSVKYKQNRTDCNYIMWYHQLKRHIKGIEVSIYIDEISKL